MKTANLAVVSSLVIVLLVAAVAFVLAGPLRPTVGSSVPTQSPIALSAAVTPQPLPGNCLNYASVTDGAAPTIDLITKVSSAAIVGTVTGVGGAQWNTADGLPPTAREELDAYHVMRLVNIDVSRTLRGAAMASLTVWVPGGAIGCSRFDSGEFPQTISPGDAFVFFLRAESPRTGATGVLRTGEMWPVATDGTVVTPVDGKLSLDQIASKIAAAP